MAPAAGSRSGPPEAGPPRPQRRPFRRPCGLFRRLLGVSSQATGQLARSMTKKLSAKDLDTFRNSLTRAQAMLSGDMSQLQQEALGTDSGFETRPGDTSDGYFQEFNLELLERDGDT